MDELDELGNPSVSNEILENLNDSQKEAVSAPLSNMLVIAGAGTGKTRVLVSRIAYLIKHYMIEPRNILAVTFTNKAAGEMRERIGLFVGEFLQRQLWASTFHSICLRLLRAYAKQAGLEPNFTVLDTDSQTTLTKRIMKELNIDVKEFKPSEAVSKISKLKEDGIRADDYIKRGRIFGEFQYENMCKIYSSYEKICNDENSVDFSELLLRTVELLESNDEIRALQHRRFKEILVDEFQDTNSIQYKFLKLMAGKNSHVMVVGDDDQSIYGWRGADYTNMHKFLKDFDDVHEILLALNYRSSQKILDMANTLIAENSDRLMEKVLKGNIGQGDDVSILNCSNNNCEASTVVQLIAKLHEAGEKYQDMAILYRNNYLSLGFEQNLSMKHIPFVIYGGQRFFERAEILDTLAYLRLLINENDDTAALRIINVPSRKLGPKVVADLRSIGRERNSSMLQVIRLLEAYSKQEGADKALVSLYKKVTPFYNLILQMKEKKANSPLNELVDYVINASGLHEMYALKDAKEGKTGEENSRVSNLGVLVSNVKEFEASMQAQAEKASSDEEAKDINADNVEDSASGETASNVLEDPLLTYLSNITLVSTSELDEDGSSSTECDAVNMMTIHSSKGLEFKHVFLVGFENTILPSQRSVDIGSDKSISEERRLAYVGITRAKEDLYISYAQNRSMFGNIVPTGASQFLRQIVRSYNAVKKEERPFKIIPIASQRY